MGYTWGYIRKAALAKLDLPDDEANTLGWTNRFTAYANEVITQVCSTIKPKPCYFKFTANCEDFVDGVYSIDVKKDDDNPDGDEFISFGSGNNTYVNMRFNPITQQFESRLVPATTKMCWTKGYNTIVVNVPGTYYVSYNARWLNFALLEDNLADDTYLDAPNDILDCIPAYIASQCYGIDDEYKAAKYRNEFELLFARIDSKPADVSGEMYIGSDW